MLSFSRDTTNRRVGVVIDFVRKNPWVLLVAAFIVLVVVGIMMT